MSTTPTSNKVDNRADEQVKFLVCCIKHANNGKPNFEAVAQEMSIVSKAAAQKRYERLLKAHAARTASKESEETDTVQTPQTTPVKRKNVRSTPVSAKKIKSEEVKKEEEPAPEPAPKATPKPKKEKDDDEVVKQETKDESDLSDAPSETEVGV
ncbi:hypothetical protein JDV02_006179 [Purpureocillium takamizusanense]|uniref:Myb-like DNA-binding domain-containing protein n=1 Tax=Purpureocillium takamizusanense TaxID=2060973 RepID=A0A9Q8QJ04_9HYPO|nr:uncharacterized protein JDV02_006179 [Purpureocillium takamizusanense]UNI20051.1 hypothetical protein JDV02_006179 [Purpureocillium takamizusanense]